MEVEGEGSCGLSGSLGGDAADLGGQEAEWIAAVEADISGGGGSNSMFAWRVLAIAAAESAQWAMRLIFRNTPWVAL